MPTKKMISELDRCAAWLLSQPHAVKTTDMAKIAPPEVKDAESWARRMMRKMDETGRAMADDVDNRSGGVWWVHPKNDFRPPEEKIEDAAARISAVTGCSLESARSEIERVSTPSRPLTGEELRAATSTTVEIEPGPNVPLSARLWNRLFRHAMEGFVSGHTSGKGTERARARLKAKRKANEAIPDPSTTSRQIVRAEARKAHKRATRPGPHNGKRFSWAGARV